MRPTFANAQLPGQQSTAKPRRKEKLAVWIKHEENGEEYLSIKINDVNGETLHVKAYKAKKKTENMPDFVAYEKDS